MNTWSESPPASGLAWRSERKAVGWSTPVLCVVGRAMWREAGFFAPACYDDCAVPVRWLALETPPAPEAGRLMMLPIGTHVRARALGEQGDGIVIGSDTHVHVALAMNTQHFTLDELTILEPTPKETT